MSAYEFFVAFALGVVEGLTEFIPVSSTGHLIIFGYLLDFTGERASTFEVVIQLGAILAVVVLYRGRLRALDPRLASVGFAGWRAWVLLAITTIPALIVGAFVRDVIVARLFTPLTVAGALAVGALLILVVEWKARAGATEDVDAMSWRQALFVGLFQCLSLWPGMSRSAATIVGGMLGGMGRRAAVEYSFLAAIPVMLAATTYDVYKSRDFLALRDLPFFAVGFVTSFLAALLAVRIFPKLLEKWTLRSFAWYRIALAVAVCLVLL